jgi:hypothetical protein
LLHDVGEFVREQFGTGARGDVVAAPEVDVLPRGERPRAQRPGELVGPGIVVQPDSAEVRA